MYKCDFASMSETKETQTSILLLPHRRFIVLRLISFAFNRIIKNQNKSRSFICLPINADNLPRTGNITIVTSANTVTNNPSVFPRQCKTIPTV